MTKTQTASQVGKLLLQYPAVASIYSSFCNRAFTPGKPALDIRVQKADTDLMYRRAKNAWYDGQMYYEKDELRGTRQESLYAIAKNELQLAHIPATVFDLDLDTTAKDIFQLTTRSSDIEYLVWATRYSWYSEPSTNQGEENVTFGNFVESELYLVVYTKPKDMSWKQLALTAALIKFETENAYKNPPKETPDLPAIHKVLRAGSKIHGFSSGGGLRVVSTKNRLSKKEFYGEAPSAEEALQYLEEDILAGGRDYSEVYGKLHPHYLTGSSLSISNVDHWLRCGNSFDCFQEGNLVCVILHGYAETKQPTEFEKECKKHYRGLFFWKARGFRYLTRLDPTDSSYTTKCLNAEEYPSRNPWMYHASRTGYGRNIWEAFQAALAAPDIEETAN